MALTLQSYAVRALRGNPYVRTAQTAGGIDGCRRWPRNLSADLQLFKASGSDSVLSVGMVNSRVTFADTPSC